MRSNRSTRWAVLAFAGLVAVTALGMSGLLPWQLAAPLTFVLVVAAVVFASRAAQYSERLAALQPPQQREDRLEQLAKVAAVAALASLVTVAVMSLVTLQQQREIAHQEKELDARAKDARVNRQKAEAAADRAVRADMKSRQRFLSNRRLARRAERTAKNTVTVLRQEGYPVPGSAGTRGATGARGPRGPGPTQAQVNAAVARCVIAGRCSALPTAAQLATAIETFCASGPTRCRPTVEQVAKAIVDYCADHACRGLTGPRGPEGKPGRDAPAPSPMPVVPCPLLDPALSYACVPPPVEPDTPPDTPPPDMTIP